MKPAVQNREQWENEYQSGQWQGLHDRKESARYHVVAGYIQRDDQPVSLLQGMGDATNVRSVDLTFDALAIDADGSGEDTVRVYLSDAATAPQSTLPVVQIPMSLSPGLTDTVHVELAGDHRVVGLFQAKSMRMSVTTSLRGPSSGNALSGTFRITGLEAVVIAGWKGF